MNPLGGGSEQPRDGAATIVNDTTVNIKFDIARFFGTLNAYGRFFSSEYDIPGIFLHINLNQFPLKLNIFFIRSRPSRMI